MKDTLNGVPEEDYKAFLDACDADDYAHEFEFKRQGMVAFFDVLGYRKLSEDVSEDVIRSVMDTLKQAHDEAKRKMSEIVIQGDPLLSFERHNPDEIRTVNISDSIVVIDRFEDVIPFGANRVVLREFSDSFCLYQFIQFCRKVWESLFDRGLPLRGAISTGTFYWDHGTIFAGKPFIEAYNVQESLSFSGLVLAKSVDIQERTRLMIDKYILDKDLLFRNLCVPVKASKTEERSIEKDSSEGDVSHSDRLEPMDVVVPDLSDILPENMAAYAEGQFKAHGKKINSQRVQTILKNTVEILRMKVG